MRTSIVTVLVLLFGAGIAAAQHHGGGGVVTGHAGIVVGSAPVPFRTYGSPSGFGSVLFPGTGTPPPLTTPLPFAVGVTFPEQLSATVTGFNFLGGPGRRWFDRTPAVWPVPYPYPVAVGNGDPYGGGYGGYQQQPSVVIVMPPQAAQQTAAPPVTIQQFFGEGAQPTVREYGPEGERTPQGQSEQSGLRIYGPAAQSGAASPSPEDRPLFLIALTDNTVYTAVAYWVEGNTLHYVTPQGRHNQVSMDLVDRKLSARLNQGQSVAFHLPGGGQ